MVDDINSLFTNSFVGEVFSTEGLSTFSNMQFYIFPMFYILIFKIFFYLYFLNKAIKIDKE
jgi:uncharacterized membrane protein YfhO